MPTDSELEAMYDHSYFDEGGAWVCGFWPGSYIANEAQLRAEAREALSVLPARSGVLLEVGCAGGFFLDEARKAGFSVQGVELNAEMADHARDALGLTVHAGLFERIPLALASFDVVVAQDVLEHARDPVAFTRRASSLLRPGGTFFLRGPVEQMLKDTIYRMFRTLARRGIRRIPEPPFHLHGFCHSSFHKLAAASGLTVDGYRAEAVRPTLILRSPKQALASVIELAAHAVDSVRGGGDFMTAVARKQPGWHS